MAAPIFYNGYLGTAAFGTTELSVVQWRVGGRADTTKFKNSRTGPIPVYAGSFSEYPISLTLDFDNANGIFSAPVSLAVSTVLTNMNLYQHQSAKSALGSITSPGSNTNPGWVFPSLPRWRIWRRRRMASSSIGATRGKDTSRQCAAP